MSQGRHRASHKLDKPANTVLRAASLAAPVVTAGAVGVGVVTGGSVTVLAADANTSISTSARSQADAQDVIAAREQAVSRSGARPLTANLKLGSRGVRIADIKFATAELDLRLTPASDAEVDGTIADGDKVTATGQRQGDYAEVQVDGEFYWVTASYLADKATADPGSLGLSMKPCATSGVESGLTANAIRVHRAVCNNFPQITSYGGRDGHGEHVTGRAIDIMTSDPQLGTQIAEFLRAHAAELHLYDVIWRQHIWTPVRAGEGWRYMSSRGSATANHYDHVHVSVY